MMAINIDTEKQKQLLDQGFFIFQRVLASGTVAKLNQMSRWRIDQEEPEHFQQQRSRGCIISYFKFPHPTFT